MHTRRHASRVSLDAGHPEHLSRTSRLGAVGDTTGAGGFALFPKAEGKPVEAFGEILKDAVEARPNALQLLSFLHTLDSCAGALPGLAGFK